MKYKINAKSIVFYSGLWLYLFFSALTHSVIGQHDFFSSGIQVGRYIGLMLLVVNMMSGKIRKNFFLECLIGIAIGVVVFLSMDSLVPISIMLVIYGTRRSDEKDIIKIYYLSTGVVILLSTVLSQIGLIDDKIFIRTATGLKRHSMGMQYSTVWAAFVFFLICTYIYYKKKLNIWHVIVVLAIDYYLYKMTDAILEAVLIILIALIPWLYPVINKKNTFISFFLKYSLALSCVIAFIVELLYIKYPDKLFRLDVLLSKRLSITANVIKQNGFHLFGKRFFMQGFGTWNFDWSLGYNYVDSFYINYTLQFGIIYMVFIIALFTKICVDLYSNEQYYLLTLFSLSSIHGIFISSIFLPQCNPFFMILFAEWTRLSIQPKLVRKKRSEHRTLQSSGMHYL